MSRAQSSSRSEKFFSTSKNLLKIRSWTFPVMRCFKWKLEFLSTILWMIVGIDMNRNIVNIKNTVWNVSKYGPEKTPYLDTFHAVKMYHYHVMFICIKQHLNNIRWIQFMKKLSKDENELEIAYKKVFKNTFFAEHVWTTASLPSFMIFETDYSLADLCRTYLLTNEAETLQNNQIWLVS